MRMGSKPMAKVVSAPARFKRYFVSLLAFALCLVAFASPGRVGAAVQAEVVRVIDGDTIEVRLDGEIRSVRYLGIDTPEIDWAQGQHQVYALEAAQANRDRVAGRLVRLEFDVQRTDVYGRLLAHVFVDDVHVNYELIEQGYAQAFFISPNLQHHEAFLAAQHDAWEAGRGLWGTAGLPIEAAEAWQHVGTFQRVAGYIISGEQRTGDGLTELRFGDDSGDVSLAVHIYPESRVLFEGSPETTFVGAYVQVAGLVEHYGRGYRIVVRDPAMLQLCPYLCISLVGM